MKRVALALLGVMILGGWLHAQPGESAKAFEGVISGRVVDESGTGMPGARVYYRMQAKLGRAANGRPVIEDVGPSGVVHTAMDGSFRIDKLMAGHYLVCSLSALSDLPQTLGCCSWQPSAAVEVSPQRASVDVTRNLFWV